MTTPNWYNIAVAEIGVREIEGSASNPRILEYQAAAGYNAKQDDVAWCGSFVSWCMKQAGVKYRFSSGAQAADWANFGKALKTPVVGAVIVFPHHVGFFAGWVDKVGGAFRLLSGNSGGAAAGGGEVRLSVYHSMAGVIAVRWPDEAPTPVTAKSPVNNTVVKGTGVSAGAVVAAVAANPEVVTDNLQQASTHFSQGTFIGIVCAIVFLVAVGYIVYSVIQRNRAEKKFSNPGN